MRRYMPGIACLLLLLLSAQLFSQTKPKAQLNHVAIFVVDVQKTGSFYKEFFQLDTIPEPFHDGKHIYHFYF